MKPYDDAILGLARGTAITHLKFIMIAGVAAELQIQNLPNTNQERYTT
jgi:hypothetical protein